MSKPVDGSSAAVFRILFGLLSFVAVVRFFTNDWIEPLYVEPEHHFKYLGFEWVQPMPGWALEVHFAVLGVVALFIAAGFMYRVSAVLFFFGFVYVELLDAITYLNHYYWLSLTSVLIVFMPLNRMWSVDAWLRPSLRDATIPAWVIWLLRAQLSVVYVFGGIAKLNADWLVAALPMKIWLYQHGDYLLVGRLLQQLWVAYVMSWAGALYDLTIVGWLLWRRSRPFAFVVLIGFHLATWQLFPSLGMFPWLMMGSMLIFFPPEWPRRAFTRLLEMRGMTSEAGHQLPGHPSLGERLRLSQRRVWLGRIAVVAVALIMLGQVLFPLRHWLYPGNVRWNEEGYRFAWRMMLSEKIGYVTYNVVDNGSGQSWRVSPDDYLTPLQTERMAINPDMIHQLAEIIELDFQKHGYPDVSVYADAYVAFNGRANAPIIDPDVDLTSVKRGLHAKPWILPEPRSADDAISSAVAVGVGKTDRDAE